MVQVTQWRGEPDTGKRRVLTMVLISLLLHLPLTPIVALLGFLTFLQGSEAPEGEDLGQITEIPVALLASEPGKGDDKPEPEPADPEPEVVALQPEPDPKTERPQEEKDAGAPDAGAPDAGLEDAGPDAGDAGSGADAGAGIGDPVAMAGKASTIADSNANVRLLIYNERIRQHALGKRIGQLLGNIGQWRDFFGPTGLDPVQDIDAMLIAGPQLRDSSEVVVVIQHNQPPAKMRAAIDALVQRDKDGQWLDAGVPAARASADRAERVFVMPNSKIVVIAPPSAAQSALSLGKELAFEPPQGGEALTAHVETPWRVFIGLPVKFPDTIAWLKVKITPLSDGGLRADVVAQDKNADLARSNADYLERAVRTASQLNLGILGALLGGSGQKFIESVSFRSDGQRIEGSITVTGSQLENLFDILQAWIAKRQPGRPIGPPSP